MSAHQLITDHLDLWTQAVTKKSTAGRGRSGKIELTGVKKLRELILELAVRGLLTDQLSTDESSNKLLEKIIHEVKQLIKDGRFKVPKETKSNSEVEAPFKIPQTWTWCSLDQIAVIARGGSPRPIKAYTTTDSNGLNWIKIGDANKGSRLITKAAEKIIPEGLHKTRMVYPGDLILSNSMSFGQPYILDIEGCIHDGWLLLRTPEGLVDKVFLYYLLLSPYAMNAFTDSAAGAVVQNLNADKVRLLHVPLPPLEEQHRIVQKVDELMVLCDRLEQHTSDQLDAHETLVDTLLRVLIQSANATELANNWARLAEHFDTMFTTEQSIDKLKQTILQLAVMGLLVEQDAGDEPPIDFLTEIHTRKTALAKERRIKRPRPLTQMDDVEQSYLAPTHWAWASFQDIADDISTGPFGSMIHKHDYVEGGTPLINPSHMVGGRIKEDSSVTVTPAKAEDLSSYKLAAGDIVMARRGEVGRCAVVTNRETEWLCGTGSFVLRFHPAMNRRFILLMFATDTVREYLTGNSVGTTMTNLNHGILKKMPVALPSAEEQHRIVQKVDELMALCHHLKERLNQASDTRCQLAGAVVEGALS
ncbi:restriction endonuclease subunit S [Halomonas sp. SH5A2]|uniref:restriction endonuclease subunit S n=1 Tax=Halomonas sp. SH5A2 TaxID=2749040 RepID=UPI00163FE02E|nr:restriction endonuclease subunit S [Halomonas sp. SH5A2]QNI04076.1 restriction endonuclease subunit S [Halomonas sp. SH5A2]